MVPGGRVGLPTPAFSGPRSTGELPRHRGSPRFYGCDAGVSIKESFFWQITSNLSIQHYTLATRRRLTLVRFRRLHIISARRRTLASSLFP